MDILARSVACIFRRMVWLAGCAALLAVPAAALADSIYVRLPYAELSESTSDAASLSTANARTEFTLADSPGFSRAGSSGNPALPCRTLYIALPSGTDPSSVMIEEPDDHATTLHGRYEVAPVPATATLDERPSSSGGLARNQSVYDADEFYPRKHFRLRTVGRAGMWNVAEVEYWPYRYNPVSGRVRAWNSGSVNVRYSSVEAGVPGSEQALPSDVAEMLANREQAEQWLRQPPTGSRPDGYLVVTSNAIAKSSLALPDFVAFQTLRGFAVRVVTEDMWGGGAGDAAADKIRRWLAAHYLETNARYVLLIGNPSPSTGDVPMKMLWPRSHSSLLRETPSDYFYADLTGNWDLDNDGYAGEYPEDMEPGGVDRLPEVYVGRIPFYGSTDDLDHILRKTIAYESRRLGSWAKRVVLPMKPLDDVTPSYQLGEEINRDIALGAGLTPVRLYDNNYALQPPPDRVPCDMAAVGQEWRTGAGVVVWMAHGGPASAGGIIDSGLCRGLDDSRPSIVFQGSCSNGTPEDQYNLAYSLLLHGAVTTVAASRPAWYYIGEGDFRSSDSIGGLAYQYASCLIRDGMTCGQALLRAKLNVPGCIWSNHFATNLYGDPSLAFDKQAPGAVSGEVLTTTGTPVPGARVRLVGVSDEAESAGDGSYLLAGVPAGEFDVCVSANGFYSQRFYRVAVASGRASRVTFRLTSAAGGSVQGQVCDIYGLPIAEASVKAAGAGPEVFTQSDGRYSIDSLPVGKYALTFSKYPFAQEVVGDCVVREGVCSRVDVVLKSRSGNGIVNGGFEGGFIDGLGVGWSSYGRPGTSSAGTDNRKYGARSQKLRLPSDNTESFAGILQRVSVIPGNPYSVIVWQRNHSDSNDVDLGGAVICRLGIDPTGGTDPAASTVSWRDFDTIPDLWHSMFRDAAAYSRSLTIFLEARRKAGGHGECSAWFDAVSLIGPTSAPSVPTVHVGSPYQSGTDSVSASWSCADSDIASYECAVSSTASDSDVVPGGQWTNVGLVTTSTRKGLALSVGDSVRVLVRARNAAGTPSAVGASEPVRIITEVQTVGDTRGLGESAWVKIDGLRVTRMGEGPECFLEQANRASGIKVSGDWSSVPFLQPGSVTSAVGMPTVRDSMLILESGELLPTADNAPVRPLAMLGSSVGVGNSGLLVTVVGRAESVSDRAFVVRDGSFADGLAVLCFNSAVPPANGAYVRVTGIAVPHGLWVYDAADVVTIRD